jgi:hypothetical protein
MLNLLRFGCTCDTHVALPMARGSAARARAMHAIFDGGTVRPALSRELRPARARRGARV